MTQDKDGFLWLATWDGLARFDGVEFKVYRHNPNDTSSIVFFEVIKVVVDSSNNVWVFGGGSICRYDRRHDNFIRYNAGYFPKLKPEDGPSAFNDILVDPEGSLLVVYGYGFYRYDLQTDRFEPVSETSAEKRNFVPSIASFDNMNNLWYMWVDRASSPYAMVCKCSYEPGNTICVTDSFSCRQANLISHFLNETKHIDFYISDEGDICFASSFGLFFLENDTFQLSYNKTPAGSYPGIDRIVWSEHGKGLMIDYLSENHADTLYEPGEIETVIAYYYDRQDNIWFSDLSDQSVRLGLSLAFRTGKYFRHYLTRTDLSGPYVIYGLYKEKDGTIWAGGRPNDHIVRILSDGEIQKIALPFHPVTYFNLPRNIDQDREGNLWISFFSDYLYRLNPHTLQFTNYSNINVSNPTSNSHINYRLVKTFGDHLVFSAGAGRIYRLNTLSGDVVTVTARNGWDIFCLYPGPNETLWAGLSGRLLKCKFDLTNQEIIEISDQYYNIEDICPGDSDDLWLAMLGGGIAHFDIHSQTTTFYTTFNGLDNNTVYSIRKDRAGNLWVSHDLGISMFNPKTKSFTNYDEKDGLKIKEFDSEAACQTSQDEILFGGIGGIVSFYPDSIKTTYSDPGSMLIISEFKVSNKVYPLPAPVSELKSIILPVGTDNFQLAFSRPDFRNGDETRYRYILKGSQSDWTFTDSRNRRVNFTSLRPGKYEFLAECTDNKGEWNYNTSLVICIPPHYYQTIIFKVFLSALALAIILLFFLMKVKQIRLAERKKQEQLKLETLRGQMNPHFIFNSLNSINYFISLNDRLNANQYITDFSRLMRAIMMNSSQEFINMEAELQAIRDYLALEHLRFSNKFDYEIVIAEEIDQVTTEITPSLVQPFIENAIWHGLRYLESRKGFLSVRFIMEGSGNLVCYVEDDGIGRKLSVKLKTGEQKKRKSRGIAIVTERLAIINSMQKSKYSVRVMNMYDDREETGTKVRIELPSRKE